MVALIILYSIAGCATCVGGYIERDSLGLFFGMSNLVIAALLLGSL